VDVEFRPVRESGENLWKKAHLNTTRGAEFALQAFSNGRRVSKLLHLHPQIPRHFVKSFSQVLHLDGVPAGLNFCFEVSRSHILGQFRQLPDRLCDRAGDQDQSAE